MSEQTQRLIAIASLVAAVVAIALDNLAFKEVDESLGVARFLVSAVLCVAVAAAIFLYLIPRLRREGGQDNRMAQASFVVGLAALASIIVFWTGLPFVLGAGAVVMGRLGEQAAVRATEWSEGSGQSEDRERAAKQSQRATQGWSATLMGALAIVAGVFLFVAVIVY
jgi:uncharacterized membrane protein